MSWFTKHVDLTQKGWPLICFTMVIIGGTFFAAGSYLMLVQRAFVSASEPVEVRVISLKIAKQSEVPNTLIPELEITSAPYAGKRYTGTYSSYPLVHSVGDVVPGLYNRSTGEIQSIELIRSANKFFLVFLLVGLVIFFAGIAIIHVRRKPPTLGITRKEQNHDSR